MAKIKMVHRLKMEVKRRAWSVLKKRTGEMRARQHTVNALRSYSLWILKRDEAKSRVRIRYATKEKKVKRITSPIVTN